MENWLADRLQTQLAAVRDRADYLDIRIEQSEETVIAYRGDRLDAVDRSFALAGGIRACYRGGWSFVTFNGLDALEESLETAIARARSIGEESTVLAPVEAVEAEVKVKIERDPRGISLAEKQQLLEAYNRSLLELDPRVQTTTCSLRDRFSTQYFVSSTGSCIVQERLDVSGRFGAIARDGNGIARQGFESVHSRSNFNALVGIEERVLGAGRRAIEQLDAKPVQGGEYTVVLDPYLSGVFIHEAFGHLSEADSLCENPQMRSLLTLEKPVGIEALNVIDDATLEGLPGSFAYDDEGVPARRKYLIKEGRLHQRLHSRETAGKMQEVPTGNARALRASYPPIVRMTNTAILPGEMAFSDLIGDIKDGIYAVRMLGGQTNGEMFTFAAGLGYKIRDGKIAEPISDVTLTGNVFQTLKEIEAIGDDTLYTSGGCGKNGQMPLPVSVGGPHLRIRNVVVGGR